MEIDVVKLSRIASGCEAVFQQQGLRVEQSTDFHALEKVVEKFGADITPHFSTMENTFYRGQAFWIGVWRGGVCVATIACKFQPLGLENLADYSLRYWPQVYRRGSAHEITMGQKQKRSLSNIQGNLIYVGEYRVLPAFHKEGVGKNLAEFTKALALLHWPKLDFLYIFMRNQDVRKGLLAAIELTIQIPDALRWIESPSQAEQDYWLAGIDREDLLDWIDDRIDSQNST